ncbi:MAG: type II toxin-antitoxin system RelE/ParE family toxin [Candidatus Wildermuthbacteria bacterium]|nr:type II toxin-antitoxin system RelE/ParE family toxin [Candidatus Wildermuthbacteria bacterium]
MIYNKIREEYRVKFHTDSKTFRSPVFEYIEELTEKEKAKVVKYIEFLRVHEGYLDEPYSRHIKEKIRELRIDFGRSKHRIFYFTFVKKTIILLHAFLKKTSKTPMSEIKKAQAYYQDILQNIKMYE